MISNHPSMTSKRQMLASLGILVVFGFGLWLRVSGLNWGLRDGVQYHPDERHVGNCVGYSRLDPVEEQQEDESYSSYLARYWHHQIWGKIAKGDPKRPRMEAPLRPDNFNYGTLPYFLYDTAHTLTIAKPQPGQPSLVPFTSSLAIRLLVTLLAVGTGLIYLRRVLARPSRKAAETASSATSEGGPQSWAAATLYLALPVLGAVLFFGIPTFTVDGDPRSLNAYGGTLLIGRLVTAWAGAASIFILYRIGRQAYGAWTGLLGAAMLATAVLHVQLSHFATVDILTSFFVLCALAQFLEIARRPRLAPYVLGAIFTGFAIASKWSAVTLPGVMLLAHACGTWGKDRHGQLGRWLNALALLVTGVVLLHFFRAASSINPLFHITLAAFRDFYVGTGWRIAGLVFLASSFVLLGVLAMTLQAWWDGHGRWRETATGFLKPWVFLVLAVPVGMAALFVGEPFVFTEPAAFAGDLVRQYRILVSGESPVVYTQQYAGTLPVLYLLDNLFYPSLDWISAGIVVAGILFAIRMVAVKRKPEDLILLAWIIPNFLIYATAYCKFPRYMAPILPLMMLLGARLLTSMVSVNPLMYRPDLARLPQWLVRSFRPAGWALITLSLLVSTLYAHAYVRDVYRKPHTNKEFTEWLREEYPGKRFIAQTWDEWGAFGAIGFHDIRDSDPEKLTGQLRGTPKHHWDTGLADADGLALVSKRAYGTTFRWPERFKNTNTLFQLLFSEQLGYRMVKVFDRTIDIGPWKLYADQEDESFKVYDHPKIVVWEHTGKLREDSVKLSADAMEAMILNPPEWVRDVTPKQIESVRDGKPIFAPDAQHPVLSWLLITEALGVCAFLMLFRWTGGLPDRGFCAAKIVGTALFAWLSWFLAGMKLVPVSQAQLICCLLALVGLALLAGAGRWKEISRFLQERRWLLIGTELVFLLVLAWFLGVRSQNPAIHWGEKPMDMAFLSAMYRAETFPTVDPWISGSALSNYYYYGYVFLGLPARLVGCPPNYFYNIAVCAIPALMAMVVFGLVYTLTRSWKAGLLGGFFAVFAGHLWAFLRLVFIVGGTSGSFRATPLDMEFIQQNVFKAFATIWTMLLWSLGLGEAPENAADLFGFDRFYWPSGHDVIFGTNANEFPIWTYLFTDLHAHAIVMPIAAAFLVCGYAWYRYSTPSDPQQRPTCTAAGQAVWITVLAVLLGTVTCTNTWNMPGLVLFTLLLTVVIFREHNRTDLPQTRPGWMTPDGLMRLSLLLIGPAIVILSWLLFHPFHKHFESRVSGAGLMQEGQTPFHSYLLFFGLFLLPVWAALVWFTAFPDGRVTGAFRRIRDLGFKRKTFAVAVTLTGVVLGAWVFFATDSTESEQMSLIAWVLQADIHALFGGVLAGILALGIVTGPGPWRRLMLPAVLVLIVGFGVQAIHSSLPIRFEPDSFVSETAKGFGLIRGSVVELRDRTSGDAAAVREGAQGFDLTTPAMLVPFLAMAAILLLRRRQESEKRFGYLLAFLVIGISVGIEIFYVEEPPWGAPSHRLNDIFKFFLIVWNLLAVVAACSLCWLWRAWRHPAGCATHRVFRQTARLGFAGVFLLTFIACLSFTVIAPYTVTEARGARCTYGPRPTLDGTAYLPGWEGKYGADDYRIISWLNWRTGEERPTICEFSKMHAQYSELARVSVFTGLPAVMGWPHHIGERGEYNRGQKAVRARDILAIYSTNSEETFRGLLAKYGIRYLIFGDYEARMLRAEGLGSPLNRWMRWGHLLNLVYHSGDAWIFAVAPATGLNAAYGITAEATPPEPDLPPGQRPAEAGIPLQEGGTGIGNGKFKSPRGVAVGKAGRIYVADMLNHRIQVFDPEGKYQFQFGKEGSELGEFKEPRDVATDASGKVYVCDTWNHRVQIFSPDGEPIKVIVDSFFGPRAIAVDKTHQRLAVADTGNHRVGVYSLDGRRLRSLGRPDRKPGDGPGEMNEPRGVAFDKEGNAYVADRLNLRIHKFTRRGEIDEMWPMTVDAASNVDFEPRLTCGPKGKVYMADPVNSRIMVWDSEGNIVGALEQESLGSESLGQSGGMGWTKQNVLLVTDLGRHRVRPVVIPNVSDY